MSVCNICGVTSEVAEFYKGVPSRCKECHKRKTRENRANNIERHRAFDAFRYKNDPRVKERHSRYLKTTAGKSASAKSKRKWIKNNPEKRRAHNILGGAVRNGRVTKPDACPLCGNDGQIEGHHHDYSRPLEVKWMCSSCHSSHHNKA